MDWAEGFFYVLIALIGIGGLSLLFKGRITLPTSYKILVRILHPGCNIHKDMRVKTLPHKVTIKIGGEDKEFTVKLEELWKVKTSLIKRPLHFIMGVKGVYLCIFRSNESGDPITNVETKATPILIRNVKRSRVLTLAFREMFSKRVGGLSKFIIIFGGTLLILYIAWQQGIIG